MLPQSKRIAESNQQLTSELDFVDERNIPFFVLRKPELITQLLQLISMVRDHQHCLPLSLSVLRQIFIAHLELDQKYERSKTLKFLKEVFRQKI